MALRSSTERTSTPGQPATSFSCSETHRSCSASSFAKRMTIACRSGLASPPTQCSGACIPVSPSISARAAIPCLNSSGKDASEASSSPSARKPFQVKAAVTQRLSLIDASAHRRGRVNRLLDRRHPGAAAGSVAKRQKFVSRGERRGASQQKVLDVVEFEHRAVPSLADLAAGDRQLRGSQMRDLTILSSAIIASGRAWSRTRPSI